MNALDHTAAPTRQLGGILSMMLAMAFLSTMDATAKWLSAGYPVMEIIFLRNLFAFLPLAAVTLLLHGPSVLRTRRLGSHLLRAMGGFGAAIFFFTAISILPLADATAVVFAAPLCITALSVPILKEKVGLRRWAAVLMGFLGVLVIVRPGAGVFQPASLLALTGAGCYALTAILGRVLSRTEATASIVFYTMLFGLLASALPLPFFWTPPAPADWLLFAVLGLLGAGGHFFLVAAVRHAEISMVAPFEYTAMVWAIALGYVLFGDLPDAWTLAGAAVVVASGLYILQRETRLARSASA